MSTSDNPIDPMLKALAGLDPTASDEEARHYFKEVFPSEVEKPCGVLLWCPYGPLVEDFPLHPDASKYAEEHGKFVRWDPASQGRRPDGSQFSGCWVECGPTDEGAMPDIDFGFEHVDEPWACTIFGHDCPAFYVAEPFVDPEAIDACLCNECRAALAAGDVPTARDGE